MKRSLKLAQIIDGKKMADDLTAALGAVAIHNRDWTGYAASLAIIKVGNDPASESYVKSKENACKKCGIVCNVYSFPETATQEEVVDLIRNLNDDKLVNGILVQLPLPKQLNEYEVVNEISPVKDVDGFHPMNVGNSSIGIPAIDPCTPKGVMQMIRDVNGDDLSGLTAVVVGRSNIVGKPIARMLLEANATVIQCHSRTKNLKDFTKLADIVVVAVGKPNTLTADMIKFGATVIDVGINRVPDSSKKSGYRLVGDCDFRSLENIAGAITPVPGGVGPMTVANLIGNTIKCYNLQRHC